MGTVACAETGWLHFRRQAPIGRYIVDFACLRGQLIVEVDGGHHARQPYSQRDSVRDAFFDAKGFRVMRFWNSDVDGNIEGVIETIVAKLSPPTPTGRFPVDPTPKGGGEKAKI
jgi:very-short-patch-repair endonuclease